MSYVSKNPRFNSQILTDQGTSSVDDPASGSHKIVNRNGLLYMRDSSGNETAIGSAGATGGINYIDNPSAETGTDGWATYADAAGTTPVDGTGGSANVTLTRTTTAGEILRGDASFELTVDAANRQGEGFSYDFTIDKADQNKVLGIWFDVDATDANYDDDDLQVFIYDKDQSQLITPTSPTNGYKIKANQYRHRVAFAPYDTTSNDYRLIIHVASTNASGYSVRFDNFEVGPGAIMTGFDGIWKTYDETDVVVTSSASAIANYKATFQPYRVIDGTYRMAFNFYFTQSGSSSFTITVPGITTPVGLFQSASFKSNVASVYGDARFNQNTNTITVTTTGGNTTSVIISGDIALASKPTWADFDPIATIYPSTDDLALSGWQSYTPVLSGNNTGPTLPTSYTLNGFYRRVGDSMEIRIEYTSATPGTGSSDGTSTIYYWSLPAGFTLDTNKASGVATEYNLNGVAYVRSSTTRSTGNAQATTNGIAIVISGGYWDAGNQPISGVGDLSLEATIPIAEFADLGQVPPIGVELASDTQYGLVKSASGSSIPILDSGTYTATASNFSNVSVSGLNGNWLRVGNIVTVSLACTTNTVTSSTASFEITLPVAATFSNAYELSGVFAYDQTSEGAVGIVEAQTTTAKITYAALNTGGYTSSIIFTYRIP